MQLSLKEFRLLAQGTQSIVTSAAVIAAMALAWHAYKIYRDAQQLPAESVTED